MAKKIYKVENNKKLFGVCGGVAEYFDMDPTIVRLIWCISCLFCGTGVLIYIICAFVFPNKSEVQNNENKTEE